MFARCWFLVLFLCSWTANTYSLPISTSGIVSDELHSRAGFKGALKPFTACCGGSSGAGSPPSPPAQVHQSHPAALTAPSLHQSPSGHSRVSSTPASPGVQPSHKSSGSGSGSGSPATKGSGPASLAASEHSHASPPVSLHSKPASVAGSHHSHVSSAPPSPASVYSHASAGPASPHSPSRSSTSSMVSSTYSDNYHDHAMVSPIRGKAPAKAESPPTSPKPPRLTAAQKGKGLALD
ncbi:unnamed protein product [Sympodiomycopsis kandeliae]